jgi:hypothetical protein
VVALGALVAALGVVNYRWCFDDYAAAHASASAPSLRHEAARVLAADNESRQPPEELLPQARDLAGALRRVQEMNLDCPQWNS